MKSAYSALFLAKKALLRDLSAGRYPSRSFHTVPRSLGGTPDQASSRSERRSTAAEEVEQEEEEEEEAEAEAEAEAAEEEEGGFNRASKRAMRGSEAERVGGGGEAAESLPRRLLAASNEPPPPPPPLSPPPPPSKASPFLRSGGAAPAAAAAASLAVAEAALLPLPPGMTELTTTARRARTEPGRPLRPERKLLPFFFWLGDVEVGSRLRKKERKKIDCLRLLALFLSSVFSSHLVTPARLPRAPPLVLVFAGGCC